MKRTWRCISVLAALFSGSILIPPQRGWVGLFVAVFRLLPQAFSALLAGFGSLITLAGLTYKDPVTTIGGLITALASSRYLVGITRTLPVWTEAGERTFKPAPVAAPRVLPVGFTPFRSRSRYAKKIDDVCVGEMADGSGSLLGDLWLPHAGAKGSGVGILYLHGAGWHFWDKGTRTAWFFSRLASQGHTVLDLAYGLAPRSGIREMLGDIRTGLIWMNREGASYGCEAEVSKLILMGASSGGQLALLSGFRLVENIAPFEGMADDFPLCGLVSYYGPVDLVSTYRYLDSAFGSLLAPGSRSRKLYDRGLGIAALKSRFVPEYAKPITIPEALSEAVGAVPDIDPELYRSYSPLSHVTPKAPPTMLLQGAGDISGITDDVRALHRALDEVQVPAALLEYPHTGHTFDLVLPQVSPVAQSATQEVERFIAQVTTG